MKSTLRTTFLLLFLTFLFITFGKMIGGRLGLNAAFVLAAVMNLSAWWFSDRIVLRMYRAQPVTEMEAPEVYAITANLAERAGLPLPRIYVIPSNAPNAFATGRDPENAVIVLTRGIVDLLNREELEGVLAHEMAHIKRHDILISSVVAALAGAITSLASMFRWAFVFGGTRGSRRENPVTLLVMALVIPVAALLVRMTISRSREYGADAFGGDLCGNPLYLAGALRKLEAAQERTPLRGSEPATAHLFVVNPIRKGFLARLFSTHPSFEERLQRLEKQARDKGF